LASQPNILQESVVSRGLHRIGLGTTIWRHRRPRRILQASKQARSYLFQSSIVNHGLSQIERLESLCRRRWPHPASCHECPSISLSRDNVVYRVAAAMNAQETNILHKHTDSQQTLQSPAYSSRPM